MLDERYLFVLGRTPLLSLAELQGYAARAAAGVVIENAVSSVAVVRGHLPEASELMRELAGTVKVARVVGTAAPAANSDEWGECLETFLRRAAEPPSPLTFGLSFYGEAQHRPSPKDQERIALTLKRRLKATCGHLRWVSGRGQPLTSVQVSKNRLLEPGGYEMVVRCSPGQTIIGRTLGVQLFEDWGERDYGRPRRNAKQGMLPPKLARIMVNMLGLPPEGTLLDPFCGSGTVLMEAALLGWPKLIGTDKESSAVTDTMANIAWLRAERTIASDVTIFRQPIETLLKKIPANSVDAIVTEPFLGRPQAHQLRNEDLVATVKELLPFYRVMLRVFEALLKAHGRAIFILPHWRTTEGREQSLPILTQGLPNGLRQLPLLEGLPVPPNASLVYERPQQYVAREIVMVERVMT